MTCEIGGEGGDRRDGFPSRVGLGKGIEVSLEGGIRARGSS